LVNGEPVGFSLELPDLNEAFKHMNGRLFPFGLLKFLWYKRKIRNVRVLTLGVTPPYRGKTIESVLIAGVLRVSQEVGKPQGECSWILEDNMPMRNGLERVGGYVFKTYRVFQKPLSN
jgi:hypothetical protein